MIPRLAFFLVAAFWAVMNVLLWRAEYGARGGGVSVPPDLVWQKILTAPDTSSLTLYQDGRKTGFCLLSTSVEQAMAELEDDKLPPEGLLKQAGYQVRFDGNVSAGDFAQRLAFNGRIQFSSRRAWREFHLKLSMYGGMAEIDSVATNRTVHLKTVSDGVAAEREFALADLQNPGALLRSLAGDWGAGLPDGLDGFLLPALPRLPAEGPRWEARLDRLMIGREPVSAYRLETRLLEQPVVIYTSTLGEILRAELPGGITAALDQPGASGGGRHD
jgi:hypothetical protein